MDKFCSSHGKISNIETKIDKITEHLASIDTTLALQNKQLELHIKRTELLEQKTEKSEEFINRQVGAIRFLMIIVSIIAAAETIIRFLK